MSTINDKALDQELLQVQSFGLTFLLKCALLSGGCGKFSGWAPAARKASMALLRAILCLGPEA
jgi:hypothetical protein